MIADGTESAARRELLAGAEKLAEGFVNAELRDAGLGLEPVVGL